MKKPFVPKLLLFKHPCENKNLRTVSKNLMTIIRISFVVGEVKKSGVKFT